MDMLSEHLQKTPLGERDLFCTNHKILQRRVNNLKKNKNCRELKKQNMLTKGITMLTLHLDSKVKRLTKQRNSVPKTDCA